METTINVGERIRRNWAFLAVAGVVILVDQVTKALVDTFMHWGQSVPAEGMVRLTYTTNTGAAFGMFQGQTFLLTIASIVGITAVLFYYRTLSAHPPLRWALGLILGGAAGNLIDRVLRGYVVDFVDVQLWQGYHFAVFNVADASINIGILLLAFFLIRGRGNLGEPGK
jgi:signal peptidase II